METTREERASTALKVTEKYPKKKSQTDSTSPQWKAIVRKFIWRAMGSNVRRQPPKTNAQGGNMPEIEKSF